MSAERALDRIAAAAATVLDTPGAVITVMRDSEQVVAVVYGVGTLPHNGHLAVPTPLCREIATTGRPLVMQDARRRRSGARDGGGTIAGYAGVPIIGEDHVVIGTLAVIAPTARVWHDRDLGVLRCFADAVCVILETRRVERLHVALDPSTIDEVSGLANRRGFLLAGDDLVARARTTGATGIVVAIELDGVESVGDAIGYDAGEDLVRAAASVLRACFRERAVLGRLGAVRFGVVAVGVLPTSTSTVIARLAAELAQVNTRREPRLQLAWRIGIVEIGASAREDLAELMLAADTQRLDRGHPHDGRRTTIREEIVIPRHRP